MVRCGSTAPGGMMFRLLLASSLMALAAAAQEPTIRVDVRLVHVLATVKDAYGQPAASLRKEDFSIRDNGVPQKIAVFERSTEQPLSVTVLVDNSGSTAKDLRYEVDSVARFLRALFDSGNPEDTVALYGFDDEVTRLNGFTRNQPALGRSLHAMRGGAGTSMYDAIYLAAGELEMRGGRHVMLIITDGGDTTSRKDYHAALAAAHNADVVMYPIVVVPILNDAGRNTGGENALTTLAASTGGRVFEPTLGAALDQAFSDILTELRTQYYLGFYPENVANARERFHRLDVSVARPELRISARSGYYGEALRPGSSSTQRPVIVPRFSSVSEISQE